MVHFSIEVLRRVNRRRFKCENCRKSFSEIPDFVGEKEGFTDRQAQTITEQIIHSDLNHMAKNNKLTEEEVWSIVRIVAKKMLSINLENLRKLGIDEMSLVKVQGNFIVVLVD